jgi:hypothetical protein
MDSWETIYYDELISIWRLIAAAFIDKRLSPSDIRRIELVIMGPTGSGTNATVIPGYGKFWSGKYCVNALDTSSDSESAAIHFARAGFLLNFSDNNRLNRKNDEWDLDSIADPLVAIIKPQKGATKVLAEEFLRWCSITCPSLISHQEYWLSIRSSYSYALWLCLKSSDSTNTSISESALISLKQKIPELSIYCSRGPGLSQNAYLPRWLNVWPQTGDSCTEIYPVLIDDLFLEKESTTKSISGVLRSSLLEPKHRYQPLGFLNHGYSNSRNSHEPNISTLELNKIKSMEKRLLDALSIPRISDSKSFNLKIVTTRVPRLLIDNFGRFESVIILLQLLGHSAHVDEHYATLAEPQPITGLPIPPIYKHTSLSLSFKTPLMSDFEN